MEDSSQSHAMAGFVDGCASKTPTLRRLQFLVALCACNISDAVAVISIGYILGYLNGIAPLEMELLGASVTIGMLVGGMILGQLGDVFGRKTCLQASTLISAVVSLASAFSPNVDVLIALRIVVGFGIGGISPAIYSMSSELLPASKKDKLLTFIASAWIFGSIYASVAGWIVLGDDAYGRRICPGLTWRAYAIVCAVPSFLAWLSTFLLIESPLFLIQRGELEMAAVSLSYMSHEDVSVETIKIYGDHGQYAKEASNMRLLFRSPVRLPFALLLLIWFSFSFTSSGIMTWVATLFIQLGYTNPFADACIINFAALPGKIVSIALIGRTGRIGMLMWGTFFAGLSILGFAIDTSNASVVLFSISFYGFFNSAGANGLFAVTSDSYFPAQSKSSAVGFLTAFGRIGAIAAQFVFGSMQSNIPELLLIASLVTFFGAAMAMALPPCDRISAKSVSGLKTSVEGNAISPMRHNDTLERGDTRTSVSNSNSLAVEY